MSEQTSTGDAPETLAETAPQLEEIPVDAPRVGIIMGSKSDAAAMEAAGHPVRLVPGSPGNLKVTVAGDLPLAEWYLQQRAAERREGERCG